MIDVHIRIACFHGQSPRLINNRGFLAVIHGDLGIGRLAVVVIAEAPADAHYAFGQSGQLGRVCKTSFFAHAVLNV